MTANQDNKSGIDWIDNHVIMQAVAAEIGTQSDDLDENLIFEEIEGEMMKRGTLAHNAIRWDFVVEQASFLLREEAKDFRLLTFIILALPQLPPTPNLPAALPLAVHLVGVFINKWGGAAAPQGRGRLRALARLVDALEALIKRAEENGLDTHYRPAMIEALAQTGQVLSEIEADAGEKFINFTRRIENIVEDAPAEPAPQTPIAHKRDENTQSNHPCAATS